METQRIKFDTLKTSRSHSLHNIRLEKMHHESKFTAKNFFWWTSRGWEAKSSDVKLIPETEQEQTKKAKNPFSPSLQNLIRDSTSEVICIKQTKVFPTDVWFPSGLRVSQRIFVSAPRTLCYSSKARGIVTFNNGIRNHWDRKCSGAGGISLAFVQCQVQRGGVLSVAKVRRSHSRNKS